VLRRTIGAGPTGFRSSPLWLSQATDWMERTRACGGRPSGIVEEYLREDRPR